MDPGQIRKYQLEQLKLLKMTDKLCEELRICYYLIGGTLLGAVRHDGFIPWDADIDIAMRREDYEKFRRYWEIHKSDRYFYQHHTTEPNHLSPHAILRMKGSHVVMKTRISQKYHCAEDGIYLDIFPLDEPPASRSAQKRQMKAICRIRRIIELKAAYTYGNTGKLKRILKKTLQLCLLPVSLPTLNRAQDRCMRRYTGTNPDYLVSMASHYSYWKQLMSADIYGQPRRIRFEDGMFLAPAKTEEYLERIYGDYMKLPPEEKRYSDLQNIAYVDYGMKDNET